MVWRFDGRRRRIFSTWGLKPMSSIRSASSRTSVSIASEGDEAPVGEILSRPGVATTTWAPCSALGLRADGRAAVRGLDLDALGLADQRRARRAPASRARGSGRARARGARRCAGRDRSTIGSPKARVLPEPVGAFARTSRPANASGRTRVWIRNGSTMPRPASACSTAALTPSARNDWDKLFNSFWNFGFEMLRLRPPKEEREAISRDCAGAVPAIRLAATRAVRAPRRG